MNLIRAFLRLLLRSPIQEAHEHVDAIDVASAQTDWLDRLRKAGVL